MKICSLAIVLMAVVLYSGCTDRLAGPALDTRIETDEGLGANKSASGGLADLSLRVRVDNAAPLLNDSLLFFVDIHNEGPDRATGVEVFIDPYNDSLLYFISASASTEGRCRTCGYNDSLGVWIVGAIPSGATEQLMLKARAVGTGKSTSIAEVIASDARDPDSTPGDGDPRQDDQDSITVVIRPRR